MWNHVCTMDKTEPEAPDTRECGGDFAFADQYFYQENTAKGNKPILFYGLENHRGNIGKIVLPCDEIK